GRGGLGGPAACAGLSARQVARLGGYEEVQTVAAAPLKLAPVDPVVAAGWVVAAQPAIDALARAVADLTDPRAIPAHGAPLVEQWAELHSRTTERLLSALHPARLHSRPPLAPPPRRRPRRRVKHL